MPVRLERKIDGQPSYQYDLRAQINNFQLDSSTSSRGRLQGLKRYEGMVYAQDQSEQLRVKIDNQLKDIHTKINPHFFMGHLKDEHDLARKRDYRPEQANAKERVALVEQKGKDQRAERVKDEIRVLDYMMSKEEKGKGITGKMEANSDG